MSKRRMALGGVIAVLLAVLVWWLAGSDRSTGGRAVTATSDAAAAIASDPELAQHGIWHTPRRTPNARPADPEGEIRLEGQVIDANQQPVAGAAVVIDANPTRIVQSEADGSFAFDGLLARSYWINAYKDDTRSDAQRIRARADVEPVIIRMYQGVSVAETVTDRETGAPIAGASVTTGQLLEQTVTTSAEGTAELRGLPPGPNFAAVEADGYATGRMRFQLPDDPGGSYDQTIELGRGAAVSGVVLGPDGKGLAGSVVYGSNGEDQVRADTQADGTWSVPAVSAGDWVFRCPGEHWAPGESAPVKLDGKTAFDGVVIQLAAGAKIAGVVVDAQGMPVAGATLSATSETEGRGTAVSEADGSFEIPGLPRATYRVVASEGDRASEQLDADVRNADVADLRVTIADATISGVVVDAAGEPVAEAEVVGRSVARSSYFAGEDTMSLTDSAGRWTIGPVAAGEYVIHASWPDSGPSDRYSRMTRREGTKAKRGERDVKVVLPAAATVRGTVVLAGAPVTRYAIGISERGRSTPKLVTSADGTFERAGLVPGTYIVTISGDDFATEMIREVELTEGATKDLGTIEVDPGRTIRGVVVDASGAPVADALVAASRYFSTSARGIGFGRDALQDAMRGSRTTRTGADGRFELRAVGTDDVRGFKLLADKPKVGRSEQLPLPAGDAEVTLTLVSTGAIAVTVDGGGDYVSVEARLVGGHSTARDSGHRAGAPVELGGLIPGTYEVVAEQMMTMRKTPAATVEVKAGETATVTVAFPTGGVTVVVETAGDCQMVLLTRGHAEDAFDVAATAMCSPGAPVELEHIEPGDYRACLGSGQCTPITVKPSPDRQTFAVK